MRTRETIWKLYGRTEEAVFDSFKPTVIELLLDIRDLNKPQIIGVPQKTSEAQTSTIQSKILDKVMDEESIRADERARLRKKLEEMELYYRGWGNKEVFFSKEDIDDLLK